MLRHLLRYQEPYHIWSYWESDSLIGKLQETLVEVPRTLPYMVILRIRLCDWSEEGDCMIRPANLTHVKAPKTLPYMDILRMALKEEELGDKFSRVEFSKGYSQV